MTDRTPVLPDPTGGGPRRLWRRRVKGFRLPEGTVCVDRTSRVYGNPFTVADVLASGRAADPDEAAEIATSDFHDWLVAPDSATRWPDLEERRAALLAALPTLAGRDVACFCAPGRACHGDVLLPLANPEERVMDQLDTEQVWTIEMPAGMKTLNSNQRVHWRTRHRLTKVWREAALLLARNAKLPVLDRARVTAEYQPPDKRRRDPANLYPVVKAAIDGLVDAGVIPDDDAKHLLGPDMRLGEIHPKGRLVLHIRRWVSDEAGTPAL